MNKDDLLHQLNDLSDNSSSTEYRTAVETIIKILRNVHENPGEPKFRIVKLNNEAFVSKIWHFSAGKQILKSAGCKIVGTNLEICPNGLKEVIDVLVEHRLASPGPSEWNPASKHEDIHTSSDEYIQSKQKALRDQNETYLRSLKEREECKMLAGQILVEQKADRQRIALLNPFPNSVGGSSTSDENSNAAKASEEYSQSMKQIQQVQHEKYLKSLREKEENKILDQLNTVEEKDDHKSASVTDTIHSE